MFDGYLRDRAAGTGAPFVAFDPVADYDEHVDGKPRYDGVRSFLASRGIELPQGSPSDPPVFALANGHIGLRGNLDEGEPFGLPGTYLNGFYELRPLPYAEAGYGDPESGQTVVNVTNGKLIRLLVDDEPFDVRYGTLRSHERVLDLREGVLERRVEWVSPTGRPVRVHSVRLVSFPHRAVAAISYEVEALEGTTPIVVQSELVANEALPVIHDDPRAAAALAVPLASVATYERDRRVLLVHATRCSGLRMAAGMDHLVDGPVDTLIEAESYDDLGRVPITTTLEKGQRLPVLKFLAYGWSSERSADALRDRSRRRWPRRATPDGSACSRPSASTWMSSGSTPMSSSMATSSFSRPCASACSTCCKRAREARSARSQPRG
jgi:trehalose/maltose hydrolase-like predicted phosphorylase